MQRHRKSGSAGYCRQLALLMLLLLWGLSLPGSAQEWRVYFSPQGGATDAIVATLEQAKKSIYIQAYSFTSAPIAKALLAAKKRGVKVEAILDKSNKTDKYSAADFLLHAGIPTYIDSAHKIAHNKVMIIDEEIVITGSFNFTKAAEFDNAENLLIIRDRNLAAKYLANWHQHLAHSEPYQGREAKAPPRKAPPDEIERWLLQRFRQLFQ